MINRNKMRTEEKANIELKRLFGSNGFSEYSLGRFEEYELYVRNKDFIASDNIITFSDVNGKLMALKPDLTLSIAKNYHHIPGYVEKVYYSENIYRASKHDHTYKEILQTGLECMGDLDVYNICEVTMLAAKSLAAISSDYVLEISHMGLISDVLHTLDDDVRDSILNCISEKNIHEIRSICHAHCVDEEIYKSIETLVSTYGNYRKVIIQLRKLKLGEEGRRALDELETVCSVLAANRCARNLNIDFSIINDLKYYSGILYKGFIEGIPSSILSGGQYDKLMQKMGKKAGAIGFAVYLDSLDRFDVNEKEYDFDVVFIYDKDTDMTALLREVRALTDKGMSVLAEKALPEKPKLKYRKLMKFTGGEVQVIEDNE